MVEKTYPEQITNISDSKIKSLEKKILEIKL